mmetsp:Transcript_5925/g.10302  ORF Transcript_5925/g.10302 Transcript_5925/m.10302 type:complete len:243 (+) Transcript_5925:4907-5635(+)
MDPSSEVQVQNELKERYNRGNPTEETVGLVESSQDGEDEPSIQVFVAPENFSMVTPGVYRSGFPKIKNFPFLKRLGLRTILTLVLEEYPEANQAFNEENNIKLMQFGVPGNKEPFVDIPENRIRVAVEELLDVRNHPVLIHCNKGKHRTGCLVGCLRKACSWSLCSILDEYIRFSQPKARFMDQQFIELFEVNRIRLKRRYVPTWLPTISEVSAPGAQVQSNQEEEDSPTILDTFTNTPPGR